MSNARNPSTVAVSGSQLIASFTTNDGGKIVAGGINDIQKYYNRTTLAVDYYKVPSYSYFLNSYNTNPTYKSVDGLNWEAVATTGIYASAYSSQIYYAGGKYIRWCSNNIIYQSSDLSTWTVAVSGIYGYNGAAVNADRSIYWHYGNLIWFDGTTWHNNGSINSSLSLTGQVFYCASMAKWVAYGYVYDGEYDSYTPAYGLCDSPTGVWETYKESALGRYTAGWYDVVTDRLHFVREHYDWTGTTYQTVKTPSATHADGYSAVSVGGSRYLESIDTSTEVLTFAHKSGKGCVYVPKFDETSGQQVANLYDLSQILFSPSMDDTIQGANMYYAESDDCVHLVYLNPLSVVVSKKAAMSNLSSWSDFTGYPLAGSGEIAAVSRK